MNRAGKLMVGAIAAVVTVSAGGEAASARSASTATASGCTVMALTPSQSAGKIYFGSRIKCSRGDLPAQVLRPQLTTSLKKDNSLAGDTVLGVAGWSGTVPNDGGWHPGPVYTVACRTGRVYTSIAISYLGHSGKAESTNLTITRC